MAVADTGESEEFLRRQLQLLHDLFVLKYGQEKVERLHKFATRSREPLLALSRTLKTLCATQQSFLVRALERMEVNEMIRGGCVKALENALRLGGKSHGATHALLFINSKV